MAKEETSTATDSPELATLESQIANTKKRLADFIQALSDADEITDPMISDITATAQTLENLQHALKNQTAAAVTT